MSGRGGGWAIVGGGLLGATLALRLSRMGRSVSLIEAGPGLGGLADSWQVGDVHWDRHYHVTLLSDLHLRRLIEDLGLGSELRWSTTRTDFYESGRFHPLNNALDYLRFPPLGLIDKVRLAGTILHASRIEDGRPLEQVTAAAWLRRLSGRRTYERIWEPLLRAKLGENADVASASFIWAVVRRLYAARRSGLKTEMFGYVSGGYARVLERLGRALSDAGVDWQTGRPVEQVVRRGGGLAVVTPAGEQRFDRVIVTAPAPIAARICRDLDPAERQALESIRYQGIVCPSVVLRRPLRGAYITYIADRNVPFTAVIEMSALIDRAEIAGRSLVYLPCYVPSDDPRLQMPDAEIEQRFLGALKAMYPDLADDDILAFRVSKARHVLAVPTLGYSDRLFRPETSVPGLSIVNSALIVNGTLNVNETVKLADEFIAGTAKGFDAGPTVAPVALPDRSRKTA